MNDNFQSLESELAQLTPARLSTRQRERMQHQIAKQLSQDSHHKPHAKSWSWEMIFGWGGAVAVFSVLCLMGMHWSTPLKSATKEALVLSNALEVQVVRLWDHPVCSNLGANQSFGGISFSNLTQASLSRRISPKI